MMFKHIPGYPGDPVLSLNEEFQQDPRSNKVNLSIGMYFDAHGKLPAMDAVRTAEASLSAVPKTHPYLPMVGDRDYRLAARRIVFGDELDDETGSRIATLQTIGGSGALKVASDFLHTYFPASEMWVSDPSWDNHRVLFEGAGLKVNTYPYLDPETGGLRFDEMLEVLGRLPEKSVVLLHGCCHNPTGVDLDPAQWARLVPLFQQQRLIAFVDMAYQGFGSGIDADAAGVRLFAASGIPMLVANSFSKNFALYGERCGALSVVCENQEEAARIQGQLAAKVRAIYSNPPGHGAAIITRVLSDDGLRQRWSAELDGMRKRILHIRASLHELLAGRIDDQLRQRYINQCGMFTYTGLTEFQVARLKDEFAVYIVGSGRMCVAGLNEANVHYVADAVAAVTA